MIFPIENLSDAIRVVQMIQVALLGLGILGLIYMIGSK